MTDHWLYCPDLPAQPADWTIHGPEAQHARVKRLQAGEQIHLFSGRGLVAEAEVLASGKQDLTTRILALHRVPQRLPRLSLAVSQPKGERLDWMLEKLTELGVSRIIPIQCERSVAHAKSERTERWQRKIIEAAKQAHIPWLPQVEPLCSLPDLLDQPHPNTRILSAETISDRAAILAVTSPQDTNLLVLIGPEGGFSDAELHLMHRAGAVPVSLGPTVLRTETAAIVAAACLLAAGELHKPDTDPTVAGQ